MEYGVYGDPIIVYPKPYSIYLGGSTSPSRASSDPPKLEAPPLPTESQNHIAVGRTHNSRRQDQLTSGHLNIGLSLEICWISSKCLEPQKYARMPLIRTFNLPHACEPHEEKPMEPCVPQCCLLLLLLVCTRVLKLNIHYHHQPAWLS